MIKQPFCQNKTQDPTNTNATKKLLTQDPINTNAAAQRHMI